MNTADLIEQRTVEEESDTVPAYEVIVLNWLEQIRSSSPVDELKELEEI